MLRLALALSLMVGFPAVARADLVGTVRVIDADTFQVGDAKVRLHGIDAPEVSQLCRTEQKVVWACGDWAKQSAMSQFGGKQARCIARDIDRYGRTVATCTVAGVDVAHALVRDGVAFAYRKYSKRYVTAERQAKSRQTGLWAMQIQRPETFRIVRAAEKKPKPQANNDQCRIKGNVSLSGEKIFHVPGQKYYSRTRISQSKGERWFCSESDARKAGWRKAKV